MEAYDKKTSPKKTTLETFATMVANGFALTATKEDLKELRIEMKDTYATKEELKSEIKNLKEDIEIMLSKYVERKVFG